jgi:hypothetical protein
MTIVSENFTKTRVKVFDEKRHVVIKFLIFVVVVLKNIKRYKLKTMFNAIFFFWKKAIQNGQN